MPIQLNYTFYAGDDDMFSSSYHHDVVESLKKHSSDGVRFLPNLPTPSDRGKGYLDAEVMIHLAGGNTDPIDESAEARRIADCMGAPWEKHEEGRVRVHLGQTGGFSSDFNLIKCAEIRLVPADRFKMATGVILLLIIAVCLGLVIL